MNEEELRPKGFVIRKVGKRKCQCPLPGLQLHAIVYSMRYFFLARRKGKTVREIIEGDLIRKASAMCISCSLDQSVKEAAFLGSRHSVAYECDDSFFYMCLHL